MNVNGLLYERNFRMSNIIMFARKLIIERIDGAGVAHPSPMAHLDNFAMRNFTNDAIFDDTLPVADGLLEVGSRVPADRLAHAMEEWFRRKSYLASVDRLRISEEPGGGHCNQI